MTESKYDQKFKNLTSDVSKVSEADGNLLNITATDEEPPRDSILGQIFNEEKKENFKKQMGKIQQRERQAKRKTSAKASKTSNQGSKGSVAKIHSPKKYRFKTRKKAKNKELINMTNTSFDSLQSGVSIISIKSKKSSKTQKSKNSKVQKYLDKGRLYYTDKLIKSLNENKERLKRGAGFDQNLETAKNAEKSSTFFEHFLQSIQSIIYIQNTNEIPEDAILDKKVYLPPQTHPNRKTIVFDLDETLIHCNDDPKAPCDITVPIKFTGGEVVEAGLIIRPYARECLEELSKHYEIVVFTASHSCYANIVLNLLDPDHKFITYRLFRESCVRTSEGIFIKDLRVFANRKLKDIALVDNAFYSYGYHLFNGIPILPFYDNKEDCELMELTRFLVRVKDVADIREVVRRCFMGAVYQKYAGKPGVLREMILKYRRRLGKAAGQEG